MTAPAMPTPARAIIPSKQPGVRHMAIKQPIGVIDSQVGVTGLPRMFGARVSYNF